MFSKRNSSRDRLQIIESKLKKLILKNISQVIPRSLNLSESTGNINFENEKSCKKIKENFGNENFCFETVSREDVLYLIKELPESKANASNDIPV